MRKILILFIPVLLFCIGILQAKAVAEAETDSDRMKKALDSARKANKGYNGPLNFSAEECKKLGLRFHTAYGNYRQCILPGNHKDLLDDVEYAVLYDKSNKAVCDKKKLRKDLMNAVLRAEAWRDVYVLIDKATIREHNVTYKSSRKEWDKVNQKACERFASFYYGDCMKKSKTAAGKIKACADMGFE